MVVENSHSNLLLVIISIGANILSHITTSNIALYASIVGGIAGTLAIINYILIFYDRLKKKKTNLDD